jgi:hypothetical protein
MVVSVAFSCGRAMVLSPRGERGLAILSTSPLRERRTVLYQELVCAPCVITRNLATLSAVSYSTILSVGMPALYSPAPSALSPPTTVAFSNPPDNPAHQWAEPHDRPNAWDNKEGRSAQ